MQLFVGFVMQAGLYVTSHLSFGSIRVIWSHFRVRVESVASCTNFNGNESLVMSWYVTRLQHWMQGYFFFFLENLGLFFFYTGWPRINGTVDTVDSQDFALINN